MQEEIVFLVLSCEMQEVRGYAEMCMGIYKNCDFEIVWCHRPQEEIVFLALSCGLQELRGYAEICTGIYKNYDFEIVWCHRKPTDQTVSGRWSTILNCSKSHVSCYYFLILCFCLGPSTIRTGRRHTAASRRHHENWAAAYGGISAACGGMAAAPLKLGGGTHTPFTLL